MADNEEGREDPAHGNEWEVVSLTASAYAACTGPVEIKLNDDKQGHCVSKDKETESTPEEHAMSRNFVFPDNQHENFPFVSGLNAVPSELAEQVDVDASDFVLSDRSIAMYGLRMSSLARNLIMQVIAGFLKIFKYRRTHSTVFPPCNILYICSAKVDVSAYSFDMAM